MYEIAHDDTHTRLSIREHDDTHAGVGTTVTITLTHEQANELASELVEPTVQKLTEQTSGPDTVPPDTDTTALDTDAPAVS